MKYTWNTYEIHTKQTPPFSYTPNTYQILMKEFWRITYTSNTYQIHTKLTPPFTTHQIPIKYTPRISQNYFFFEAYLPVHTKYLPKRGLTHQIPTTYLPNTYQRFYSGILSRMSSDWALGNDSTIMGAYQNDTAVPPRYLKPYQNAI